MEDDTRNAVIASYDGKNQVNNIPENLFIRRWDLTKGCQIHSQIMSSSTRSQCFCENVNTANMQQARWGKFKMSNWYFFGVKTGEADEAIKLACKGVLTEV